MIGERERRMAAIDLSHAEWRKSTRSTGTGECVEVADLAPSVAVRDSKDPEGKALILTHDQWINFVGATKSGIFDLAD